MWLQRNLTPPAGDGLLAAVLINPAPPTLERTSASETMTVPIRSVAYNESSADVPAWLTATPARPRVYLTLGTVSFGAVEVLSRAIAEIAALDVDVLVTVGPEGEPASLGEMPDNVHVERFVAQSAVLPLIDLVVHHGGTGTVLSAVEVGLPQLLLPQGADQFFNAEILRAAGAARALPKDAQQPGAIGKAVSPPDCAMRSPRCPPPLRWFPRWSTWRARSAAGRRAGLLRILHPEPDLHSDLEVLDLAVDKVPADVGDLEPVQASHRSCRALDPDADSVVNSLRGGAYDLG
jgi:Protein of unknown function (DUF1205)